MNKSITDIGEKDLLRRLREGDELAFELLYKKHSLSIYANIMRMVHSEDVADDLLQEVFLKIWENRAKIDLEKSFIGFLFTCSRFLVLNYLRSVSVERQMEAYFAHTSSELYQHVEQDVYSREIDAMLQQAIAQLPPQRQKIYSLCKIDGKSYEEVAESLGISKTTVQDHIVKANRHIKAQFEGYSLILLGFLGIF